MRRLAIDLISNSSKNLPIYKKFEIDLQSAIEKLDKQGRRKSSQSYKPSSMKCKRCMYFMRSGAEQDNTITDYQAISMADTGTRRHEAIQTVLEQMDSLGYDWEYLDVGQYVKDKKLKHLLVVGKRGAETQLYDPHLHVSFLCDGIVRHKPTGKCYLFEFKNQISFKAAKHDRNIDEEHHNQVETYCMELDLDGAFVTYENRDNCTICVPELYTVSDEQKQKIVDLLTEVEYCVINKVVPKKVTDTKICRWCSYKSICRRC